VSRSDRILIAAGGAALVLAAAAGFILLAPPAGATGAVEPDAATLLIGTPSASSATRSPTPEATTIVVDVEGAVVSPGIRELAAGSRVADALEAAGGYAPHADLDAAATALNLAEVLEDGAQVLVPRVGAAAAAVKPPPAAAGGAPPASVGQPGGPVDLNTASADELDALPGIGPVTVDRIIQARAERPFSSLQDAVDRGALDRGQLQKVEGLATAG